MPPRRHDFDPDDYYGGGSGGSGDSDGSNNNVGDYDQSNPVLTLFVGQNTTALDS